MVGSSGATVIFDASPTNTTLANNGIGGQGTLTGVPGALQFQNNGSNFNFSAFTSTDDINTLNGSPITDADTVTMTINVTGIGIQSSLEFSGIRFPIGLSA